MCNRAVFARPPFVSTASNCWKIGSDRLGSALWTAKPLRVGQRHPTAASRPMGRLMVPEPICSRCRALSTRFSQPTFSGEQVDPYLTDLRAAKATQAHAAMRGIGVLQTTGLPDTIRKYSNAERKYTKIKQKNNRKTV